MVSGPVDVTVVIPTRDRWPLISRTALYAALRQENVTHEVVVVDDGSVDETPAQLSKLARTEPRVRTVRHESSLGVAKARNAGIAAARGEWVAFLDDDDIWSPRKLAAQLETADDHDAAFVYAASVALDERLGFLYGHDPPEPGRLAAELLERNVMWGGCSNVMVRTDVLHELGGFDEKLFQLADWDLWIRLALGARPSVCRDTLVGCLMHASSMLLTDRRDVFPEFDHLVEKHRHVAAEMGVETDRVLFSRWVASGYLRSGQRLRAARTYLREARASRNVGNVVRAGAAILGERPMSLGRTALASIPGWLRPGERVAVEPAWVELYRRPETSVRTS